MYKSRLWIPFALIIVILAACRISGVSPTEQRATPTILLPTQTIGFEDTPSPEPTLEIPTSTPEPVGLGPDKPYILYGGTGGIWISNPDGSSLTRLSEQDPGLADLHGALSADGEHLAIVVQTPDGLELVIVHLPDGKVTSLGSILQISQDELITDPTGEKSLAYYAINQYPNLAWQPGEGRYLAFTGAVNGPTSDLYVFDFISGDISQLTDGDPQAIQPVWSPDGQYLLHYGVSWVPPFGGAIVGYNRLDGVWSVRISDKKVTRLPSPKSIATHFVGWLDSSRFVTYDSSDLCPSKNLRSMAVQSGESETIMPYAFDYAIDKAPAEEIFLFTGSDDCPGSLGRGIFLLPGVGQEPVKLSSNKAFEIDWLPESGVFQAYPEFLTSSDGKQIYLPPVYDKSYEPAVSIQGYEAWEVIEDRKGRVMVKSPKGEWRKILDGLVDELIWDPVAGDTLIIALSDGNIHRAVAPDFAPEKIGFIDGGVSRAIWVK